MQFEAISQPGQFLVLSEGEASLVCRAGAFNLKFLYKINSNLTLSSSDCSYLRLIDYFFSNVMYITA